MERTRERLEHILEAISAIGTYTAGKSRQEFVKDRLVIDAVERNIERLSEACRHIPEEMKARHADIPWKKIAGIGNVLRHDYPDVSPGEIWDTVVNDLPPLEAAVESLIAELEA